MQRVGRASLRAKARTLLAVHLKRKNRLLKTPNRWHDSPEKHASRLKPRSSLAAYGTRHTQKLWLPCARSFKNHSRRGIWQQALKSCADTRPSPFANPLSGILFWDQLMIGPLDRMHRKRRTSSGRTLHTLPSAIILHPVYILHLGADELYETGTFLGGVGAA